MANDERNGQRSRKAKEDFDERKKVLQDQVPLSEKDEYGYDDLIRDISELLLSGERIFRNPDSVGTSSQALTTMFWNLGNWSRGKNWMVPSFVDYQKLYYKEEKPGMYKDHVPEDINLFLQDG